MERPITQTNIFLREDAPIEARGPVGTTGFMLLMLGDDSTQVFVHTREQAERLFDAVADIAMSFRERFPDTATIDATIVEEPNHV